MEDTLSYYTLDALEKRMLEGQLYAIVDAVVHADVAGFAAELIEEGLGSAIPDLGLSALVTEDAIPYVVKVSPRFWRFLTHEIWPQSDEHPAKPSWGFFFEISNQALDFNALAQHWRTWYFVRLPQHSDSTVVEENIRAVFRYFDPRLTDAFLDVSNDLETAAFFGPLSRLLLPQADGTAQCYVAPQRPEEPATSSVRLRREFTMRKEHLNALELRRLEQRLPEFLVYLEKHFEEGFRRWQIDDREGFIRWGLKQATQHDFLSERACVGWLTMQLLHGLNFATEQAWAIDILNDKQHTVGAEDRADRLIRMGFDQARSSNDTHPSEQQGAPS